MAVMHSIAIFEVIIVTASDRVLRSTSQASSN